MMNLKHQIWMAMGSGRLGLRLIGGYARLRDSDMAIVDANTEIVIEGYPRSANTSAVAAFRIAQKRPVNIAHHVHGVAQIRKACDLHLPCIVLLRDPVESVLSLCVRDQRISLNQAIRNYIGFYREVLPLKERVVVGEFAGVLNDFDSVIGAVNRKYNTSFRLLGEAVAASDLVKSEVEGMDRADNKAANVNELTVALPSQAKKVLKGQLRKELEGSVTLRKSVSVSYELFEALVPRAQ